MATLKSINPEVYQPNNAQAKPQENPKVHVHVYASIPCDKGVLEQIRQILNREYIRQLLNHLKHWVMFSRNPRTG